MSESDKIEERFDFVPKRRNRKFQRRIKVEKYMVICSLSFSMCFRRWLPNHTLLCAENEINIFTGENRACVNILFSIFLN